MENKIKIAFFEIKPWEKDYLISQLKGVEVSFFEEKLSAENVNLAKGCEIISCFVDSDLHKNILSQLNALKMISTRSAGFDHIDLEFCRKNNITVCGVPTYGENTVAEHTFALILALTRKIYQSIERTKKGDFSLEGLQGFDLKEKTLGIIGLGHIGQHVARIAMGFEMQVLVFDINQDKKMAKKLHLKYASFEDVLKNSDIISLHVPYNKDTHHLIDASNISIIKKGAYLINTSRGGVVQTSALVEALGRGILAGAGLDVLEEENFIKEESHLLSKEFNKKYDLKTVLQNHILLEQENVIITPHNAFNSKEALKRILETTMLNIQSFLKNKPINLV